MRRVADAIIAATDCRIVVEIEHREGLLPLVLSGVGAAVVADSWRPLADAVGLQVRRLVVEDQLDVALVWQRHRAARPRHSWRWPKEREGTRAAD
jgi:DNA-binding transcriptional LysR family regulator